MIRTIKNLTHLISAFLATVWYGFPGRKMTVIAVTGTDGKTSTTHLIYHILKEAQKPVSMVSSIAAVVNGTSLDTGFHVTTPSPWFLQKLMHKAKAGGSKFFILEVTSHGLDQYRTFATSIDIGVITTITHEHLDYHKTLENYKNTKTKVFHGATYSVFNADDQNADLMKKKASGAIVTYAIKNDATYTPSSFSLKPAMSARYHLYNCLAAASVASILSIDSSTIERAIASFPGIPGRMDEIKTGNNFRVFIDFAHKPFALQEALTFARSITSGKVIVVFGSAGLRDKLKRPMMGEIAAALSDITVLTAEDPRTEDVRVIIDAIAQGCIKGGAVEAKKRFRKKEEDRKLPCFYRVPDRQEAINMAIRTIAKRGDVVLLCGKGHEKSMCYGKIEYPWDEYKAVAKALSYASIKTSS